MVRVLTLLALLASPGFGGTLYVPQVEGLVSIPLGALEGLSSSPLAVVADGDEAHLVLGPQACVFGAPGGLHVRDQGEMIRIEPAANGVALVLEGASIEVEALRLALLPGGDVDWYRFTITKWWMHNTSSDEIIDVAGWSAVAAELASALGARVCDGP